MNRTRLVPILCLVMLASVAQTASAQLSAERFFPSRWFAQQGGDQPTGKRNGNAGRPGQGPSQPPPQEIRPQGDLRGDIYNHIREQREEAPRPPQNLAPRGRGNDRDRNGR